LNYNMNHNNQYVSFKDLGEDDFMLDLKVDSPRASLRQKRGFKKILKDVAKGRMQIFGRLFAFFVFILTCSAFVYCLFNPNFVSEVLQWIQKIGFFGNIIVILLYILIAFPFAFGYMVLTLSCGFIYTYLWANITVAIGILLGSSISYWLCRTIGKSFVAKKIESNKKFRILFQSIQKNGFTIVLMVRFTPLPFGIQNAIFSVPGISFLKYLAATNLGMLPEGLMWTYLGHTARSLLDIVSGKLKMGGYDEYLFYGEIVIAILLFVLMALFGRIALKRAVKEEENKEFELEKNSFESVKDWSEDSNPNTEKKEII